LKKYSARNRIAGRVIAASFDKSESIKKKEESARKTFFLPSLDMYLRKQMEAKR
jgi:hypothetical protein